MIPEIGLLATHPENSELRAEAHRFYISGDFQRALESQIMLVNGNRRSGELTSHDFRVLALCYQAVGDIKQAYMAWRDAHAFEPGDAVTKSNLALIAAKFGKADEAVRLAEEAVNARPDDANCWTILANVQFRLGRLEEARQAGLRSLKIKDEATGPARHSIRVEVPPFGTTDPKRNVIAYSLWGNNDRYLIGAERNAMAAPFIYEGWSCRFYVDDSVPPQRRQRLIDLGADIVMMPRPNVAFAGLFWRFLVANDPTVDRYLVRDADSIVNARERVAVDDWIASGRHFHVMRDFWTHTGVMLAGLWGGVRGALPPLVPLIETFLSDNHEYPERTLDQRFLREAIWPIVRQSALVHDSVFRFGGAVDFPPFGRRASGCHVGQNDALEPKSGGRELPAPDVGF
ncbi:tetratricopeptide repeat protein [Bradyrhizobium iriomotense]|uniref:tetratricopeptide repeat protein n=1 Tax=Bradyrhizobium iriomotense TaxID=441950 RepID=UPI001B8A605A|nr:tetratricopeptide repeat protein [Bradyrhizobium iriomotense]MBR0786908.1 tetratricopeptide repeat protein [Bradyrhizobium iriomotense]